MRCEGCNKDIKTLFEVRGENLCLICKRNTERELFKKGTRVYHKNMGYGTVTHEPYCTINFTTWTCVKYDDFVGQKNSLCGETDELMLVKD